ncbi:MAG TPA: MFS transporter [Ktedonobacteraceae bacterium]|jgi:MFS family permease|nr:MFS transporter [Ktedonobacteraceae bacterium]
MASEAGGISKPVAGAGSPSGAAIIARQDRIPVWSLSYLFIGIIGVGFLFTFFDIFVINVSFIQTCTQILSSCNPGNSVNYFGLPVELNLAGYVVGALILSPLSDRFGRRNMLLYTLLLTGIGSLYTVFVNDYTNFIIARTITGLGIGADLALVNTYINEVAPTGSRARYTSLIFIMSALGAFFGIWVGLWLTTPAAPFPNGLPFAMATVSGPQFLGNGWRVMYGIGALLALIGILMRFQLPESPRWLISRGRVDEADQIVTDMEERARRRMPNLPPPATELPVQAVADRVSYTEIFSNPLYLRRTIFLVVVWFLGYVTVYSIAQGLTTLLAGILPLAPNLPPAEAGAARAGEAGMIAAFGTFGFILTAIFAYFFGERLERKVWLPISAVLTLIGGLMIALFTANNFPLAAIGSIITFFGFNLWVPMTYTWSTENYPTRARATGFALVDGIGHLGGGVGILVIAPLIPGLLMSLGNTTGAIVIFLIIVAFIIVAAIIAQFGTATRDKRLDEVSP